MTNFQVWDDWIMGIVHPPSHWSSLAANVFTDQSLKLGGNHWRRFNSVGLTRWGSVISKPSADKVRIMFPIDMTTKHDHYDAGISSSEETSPPPLTKLVHRKPSSPREFFEKLYGPDTRDERSPSPEIDVEKHDSMSNVNNNSGYNLPHHHHGAAMTSSYLPAFPLPPHEVGILNLESVPFPGGLAAFRKLFWMKYFPKISNEILFYFLEKLQSLIVKYFWDINGQTFFKWQGELGKMLEQGDKGQPSARNRQHCWRWNMVGPNISADQEDVNWQRDSSCPRHKSRFGFKTEEPRTRE